MKCVCWFTYTILLLSLIFSLSLLIFNVIHLNSVYVFTCTSINVYILAVTFPSLEGVAQRILRRYTKAGPAMESLSDAAVTIIKTRQQEGTGITVRLH